MVLKRSQINTNSQSKNWHKFRRKGGYMKNTLIGAALLTAVSLPTSAGMLGLDWEATGEYNIDTEV